MRLCRGPTGKVWGFAIGSLRVVWWDQRIPHIYLFWPDRRFIIFSPGHGFGWKR